MKEQKYFYFSKRIYIKSLIAKKLPQTFAGAFGLRGKTESCSVGGLLTASVILAVVQQIQMFLLFL